MVVGLVVRSAQSNASIWKGIAKDFFTQLLTKKYALIVECVKKYARKFMWKKLEQVIGIFRKYFLPMP